MTTSPVRFGLYVSAVRGHLVTRFGTDRRGIQSFIGAYRAPGNPTEIVWDEETIIPLGEAEVARYRREYERLIAGGALKKRTAAEYQTQVEARTKAEKESRATPKATPGPVPVAKAADEKP